MTTAPESETEQAPAAPPAPPRHWRRRVGAFLIALITVGASIAGFLNDGLGAMTWFQQHVLGGDSTTGNDKSSTPTPSATPGAGPTPQTTVSSTAAVAAGAGERSRNRSTSPAARPPVPTPASPPQQQRPADVTPAAIPLAALRPLSSSVGAKSAECATGGVSYADSELLSMPPAVSSEQGTNAKAEYTVPRGMHRLRYTIGVVGDDGPRTYAVKLFIERPGTSPRLLELTPIPRGGVLDGTAPVEPGTTVRIQASASQARDVCLGDSAFLP